MAAGSGRTSPPTGRVLAVLEFLAAHPGEQFGLSELTRRLELSKPTCLGIVTTLTRSGYVVRDPAAKTYRLGPALIALGRAAQESMRITPAARSELQRLCDQFCATTALSGVIDDRITLLELVCAPGVTEPARVGQSYPFAPPVGLMYVLWDDAALRAWLARQPTVPLRSEGERLERVVAECRADGYLVERLTAGGRRLYALMAGLPSELPEELRALLGELVSDIGERVYLRDESDGRSRHDISVISAPVYDHRQRPVMVVSLHVERALTDGEIATWARGLLRTADALTRQLGGTTPAL
ncbi:helix-turn-helix domain-containing protein [Mycobacterium koreense]|uniref:ArsR family transcriptional regulator n=1 Tax=Mycolicibacillus koreensis TaxID=1069220 RepID=A0A7I7SHW6_9MYCO|nr:helix-turn-helix domain-containing protein [Mycolicibacillus koreensis]MCV7246676.1 helix-turn-helix domain-containing protein [Mycolicibacillus koreensis]OSC30327.1 ArsR family transcriptional regulator [Mycolicibacillus koreensis]BBY56333.1 transcriptional regulator [Mycolicibacillus koreensis]